MRHVVQFSTGAGSAEVAWRVVERYGSDNVTLLTADTLVEDKDNWRFARDVVDRLCCEWVRLADGRTPMQVGRDLKCVPNNRMAVCSRVLKRELLRQWIDENCDPEATVIYLGFDWSEDRRHKAAVPHWLPFRVESPLMQPPYVDKPDLVNVWRQRGIKPSRLYELGWGHSNCGGACVRAGQAPWRHLLTVMPNRYAEWEAEEEKTRAMLGKDVSILRDRTGGTSTPLSLRAFRERLEQQPSLFDPDDIGACGCTDTYGGAA